MFPGQRARAQRHAGNTSRDDLHQTFKSYATPKLNPRFQGVDFVIATSNCIIRIWKDNIWWDCDSNQQMAYTESSRAAGRQAVLLNHLKSVIIIITALDLPDLCTPAV